ncbi:uncharacterized protein LOC111347314 isoform X1 [Stylophora pistillata]|uniref:uncharacterized protein LOC111347314 isoform X1 n=1 Tax=Stylophora pistillata TaxID=50429 RepID=UPI000C03C5BE|nr:uncharacterized protein LOC111347314 isoform X1 [Stylophora pistillata]
MTLQPFTKEQLNYFKFAFVVVNEFPKALRQTFKNKWDNIFGHLPGFQPWDDSVAVRNMFLAKESGSTKVPTHLSYDAWDCTALFQATIFSKSFSMPDGGGHHRTLSYLFVRPHRLPTGGFHASVISRTGNDAESFALAIDQLRLLRNAFCHSPSSEIPKATFNMYLQLTKETFQALGVSSSSVNAIGSLAEKDFPIGKVPELEDKIRKERQAEIAFLKKRVEDELISIRSENTEANQERRNEAERVVTVLREEIQQLETRLQEQNERHSEEMKKEKTELKETIRFDLERSNQAREKDAKSAAQERKETRQQLAEINQKLEEIPRETTKQVESNPSLPKSNLPSMVPYFTGREKECDEVFAHVTNKATHLVSIWGSPGFGKTSTAIAVGHRLQAQDLPVCFVSLRGMRLTSDLTSKFLGLFTPQSVSESQRLKENNELCWIFS